MKKEDFNRSHIQKAIGMILGIVYRSCRSIMGLPIKLRHINLSVTLQELF